MTTSEIHGTARVTIHEGKLEDYKRLAAKCVEVVRAHDTGTLEYEIFIDEAANAAFVHERYRDSAAGLEHMKNIGALAAETAKVATITGEICGTPSPDLRALLEQAGVKIYAPLIAR